MAWQFAPVLGQWIGRNAAGSVLGARAAAEGVRETGRQASRAYGVRMGPKPAKPASDKPSMGSRIYGGAKKLGRDTLIYGGIPMAGFYGIDAMLSPSQKEMLEVEYTKDLQRGFRGSFKEWVEQTTGNFMHEELG